MSTKSTSHQLITLPTFKESLLWSIRVARWSRVFPKSQKELEWGGIPGNEGKSIRFAYDFWQFMVPFFSSRGYIMFVKDPIWHSLTPAPAPKPAEQTEYPFSRVINKNLPASQCWASLSTWAARDRHGRDVMIKAISSVSEPSNELKVMSRLNEKELRSDPYNHTIHALEFLTFDEIVFVVMPRWDSAFLPDFATVSELMEITKAFLEVFVFLHKHRIVHHDFLVQNTGINATIDKEDVFWHKGLRAPGEVQYALLDFGNALMFPEDTDIEDVVDTRPLNFALRDAKDIVGPYNPFKVDMSFLGLELQVRVRHIENFVPELGPFFDRLVDPLDPTQLTASQALSRFMEIYDGLSESQLKEPVDTWVWQKDSSKWKAKYSKKRKTKPSQRKSLKCATKLFYCVHPASV